MAAPPPPTPVPDAVVYRDDHGVPHIVADNEVSAWYALGYEQARDALLFVQFACKAAKGELTWARGIGGLANDVAVKMFNLLSAE
jgi:penicillin amidase